MVQEMTNAGMNGIATVRVNLMVLHLSTSVQVQPNRSAPVASGGLISGTLSPDAVGKKWDGNTTVHFCLSYCIVSIDQLITIVVRPHA
jgi:hypothetical protein